MSGEWKRGTFTYDVVGLAHTTANLMAAFTSFLTQCGWSVPAWSASVTDRYFVRTDHATSDVWHFTGDGPTQKCGLRVAIVGSTLSVYSFLENTAGNGSYRSSAQALSVTIDTTAPNNYLLIGGEFGIYLEAGRDGLPSNLGHGFIGTFLPVDEWYSAKNAERKWTSQGFVCHLMGNLAFSADRTHSIVTNDGTSRKFTAYLAPYIVRGSTSVFTNSQVDDRRIGLSHQRLLNSIFSIDASYWYYKFTLGSLFLSGMYNGRYVVSGLVVAPSFDSYNNARSNDGSGSTTTSTVDTYMRVQDGASYWRRVPKFAQVEYTMTPWANIVDAVSGETYRVANIPDGGRTTKIAVSWPAAGDVVTVALN
jgi:hypothetical protein